MTAEPKARLLDITRLVSRIGRGPLTGIDRVERAYLKALLALPTPVFLLLATPIGYLLLPREAGPLILHWLDAPGSVPAVRPERWLSEAPHRQARAALRRRTLARAPALWLARAVRRLMPQGGTYLNVGHANLTRRGLSALQAVPGLKVVVMIHDVIPLDHPAFCRPGAPEGFAAAFGTAVDHADLILCPARTTATDIARRAASAVAPPPILPVPLGIDIPTPDATLLPEGLDLARPYFVALGTIEPRKNHTLLLDAWAELARCTPAQRMPQLFILGRRGWRNEAVFERLDALGPGPVCELPGLPDRAVAALLTGARALLMPSLAEGYGLPVIEAAHLGTPVLCSDLPVFREILGDYAVYLPSGDMYPWVPRITEYAGRTRAAGPGRVLEADASWESHFRTVFSTV